MDKEPSAIVGVISAFVTAVLGLAAAFGLGLGDDQRNAILAVIGPTIAGVIAVSLVIRQFVVPVDKAEKKIDEAYEAREGIDPRPTL